MDKGDLVWWYDLYDDDIVKDAGSGVVLESKTWRYDSVPERGPNFSSNIIRTIHRVYKFKTGNEDWYSENNLELLSEKMED